MDVQFEWQPFYEVPFNWPENATVLLFLPQKALQLVLVLLPLELFLFLLVHLSLSEQEMSEGLHGAIVGSLLLWLGFIILAIFLWASGWSLSRSNIRFNDDIILILDQRHIEGPLGNLSLDKLLLFDFHIFLVFESFDTGKTLVWIILFWNHVFYLILLSC